MFVEPVFSDDAFALTQPVPATKRQAALIERGKHHFTVPPYKMGTRPKLHCWCGDSVEMNGIPGPMEDFVLAHTDCAMKAEEASE